MGGHIFGCDVCQEVCPWNSRAPFTEEAAFAARALPDLEHIVKLSAGEFNRSVADSPIARARHSGLLRNAAVAMGNLGLHKFREPLEELASSPDEVLAEHAQWALKKLPG